MAVCIGANGCGKTTITEALKFAVCGAMPPGNKNGHAFIHDPKSLGESSVKANVKLRFTNQAGNSMVVVRSCEVTQKKKTMTFKQLDGVLRTTDIKTGNRISLSVSMQCELVDNTCLWLFFRFAAAVCAFCTSRLSRHVPQTSLISPCMLILTHCIT